MWNGWPISRVILLFTAIALLIIFVQVTLFHYRQNFRHWAMWGPVIGAPVIGFLALALTFYNLPWLRTMTTLFLAVGVLSGAAGTVMHVRGVGQRVDGYKMQNFLIGPPITLPLMVAAMSVLGLIAIYWR
ncbi:hypothetical protein [Desulfolucanica intricata]|uniref:hypothetical protein n=1 Tax=Desulfolucanica intricata TaxID=1285191 RepID=UPI00083045C3|nr:hypothetical protein [Desulfolucanica intricata]